MKSELQIVNPRFTRYQDEGNYMLSFSQFEEYIRDRHANEKTIRKHLFQFILEQFKLHPEWLQPVDWNDTAGLTYLYELIFATVVPSIADEHSELWGLGMPMLPVVFYGTNGLYNLLQKRLHAKIPDSTVYTDEAEIDQWHYTFTYSYLLRKIYQLEIPPHNEFTYSYIEEETGLLKYMTVKLNLDFVNVTSKGPLPLLDVKKIAGVIEHQELDYLRKHLPLSNFHFNGFSILTINNSTEINVIENMRNAVVDQDPRELISTYQEVLTLLKSLIGNSRINFGILPLLNVNKHLVIPYSNLPFSFLIKSARSLNIPEPVFLQYLERYCQEPSLQFMKAGDEHDDSHVFTPIFYKTNAKTLALIPVFHNNNLVGILEAYCHEDGLLDEASLSSLENALPLLAQLLQKSIHEFNSYIDFTIKDVFTSLQPAVEWKFKEAVWSHMKELRFEKRATQLPGVSFEQVYAMYGSVDIRNSTMERNKALQSDLRFQVTSLLTVLDNIGQHAVMPALDVLAQKAKAWQDKIETNLLTIDEMEFNDFISKEVDPLLREAAFTFPLIQDAVDEFIQVNDEKGCAFQHRRALEESMQKVNTLVGDHLEVFRKKLQSVYPFYFEKFRTDGIEYDIYLGQSIAPEKPFNHDFLSEFRLKQIRSMAEVVQQTRSLLPRLALPLQTTQLIFINPLPIDISFRNDERRFDVEGAYNIRYQVIKKRIDKVNIKDSKERLTQPGKIAMVYYNNLEGNEYRKYIRQLQTEGILTEDFEELELEELQGISGLKAMRVSVN